jgi:hypothetical protein
MAVSSNSNDRFGMGTLSQTFEHALIGSDSASLIVLTKAVSALAEVELLMVAISGGSDGLLTTGVAPRRLVSPREQLRTIASRYSSSLRLQ